MLRGTYKVPIRVAVARWAAEPIVLDGGSSIIVPTVIGPDQVPSIDDPGRPPALPELAVLSSMAHGRGRSAEAIGRAALAAIDPLEPDACTLYTDVVLQSLSKRVRELLEAEMRIEGYEYKSKVLRDAFKEGEARGEARGEVKPEAQALLKALTARGIVVGEDLRQRVLACQDIDQLDDWLQKAVRADSLADVFGVAHTPENP